MLDGEFGAGYKVECHQFDQMSTYKTAKAVVVNNTGRVLRSAHVAHKYSDDYKNSQDWGSLQPGEASSPMTVEYSTGLLTTGRDWWAVTWEYSGEERVYYTSPVNFRGLIDWLESAGSVVIQAALAAAAAAESAGTATAAGAAAGAAITSMLLNSESTDGFKQHILRDEDAGQVTSIVINADNTVEWRSPSGTSSTGSSAYGTFPITDFVGSCGEGSASGVPMVVSSPKGLQPNEQVSVNGNTDLSACLVGNDGACVYSITLNAKPGVLYDYDIVVDARGPSGFGSGSIYLAFTDQTGDTYKLSVYSSSRSKHTVSYNSQKPAITKIYWSDYSFSV